MGPTATIDIICSRTFLSALLSPILVTGFCGSTLGHTGKINREKAFMEYMKVLIADTGVMHSFFSEIGPPFVVCHDFERAGKVEQSGLIANSVSPNSDVADRLKKTS